ncbi:hypothetical protein L1987_24444 [Smallanthus sonchifolius]|uniref:Uncharacterized protein n=1 Tax=Smallanthus sonchifolius TaxID=185202 RepID=A0ACB9IJP3_9ASTR|nr:hypothetical protein L1987_24444 [Smallanthus sonchifolius]
MRFWSDVAYGQLRMVYGLIGPYGQEVLSYGHTLRLVFEEKKGSSSLAACSGGAQTEKYQGNRRQVAFNCNNDYRKIDVPIHQPFEFSAIAPGLNHTCALRSLNNSIVCWGGGGGIVFVNVNSTNASDYHQNSSDEEAFPSSVLVNKVTRHVMHWETKSFSAKVSMHDHLPDVDTWESWISASWTLELLI